MEDNYNKRMSDEERVFKSPEIFTDSRMHAIWFALLAWNDTITHYDLYPDEPNDRSLVIGVKFAELSNLYDSLYNYDGTLKKRE
jgi:hypothetical protein